MPLGERGIHPISGLYGIEFIALRALLYLKPKLSEALGEIPRLRSQRTGLRVASALFQSRRRHVQAETSASVTARLSAM
jgi:hypothetical protein